MTPREILGCLYFVRRLQRRERGARLVSATLAARGKESDVKNLLRVLDQDD